uniref:Transmembrane protein 134 n=1 Tax=Rattus norvegicus TaxID=10116 RepID=A0ABK0LM06_RAT
MSAARPQFSIDDAFELTLEDAGPGPESSGVARFGPLHFDRRARFEVTDEEKQSRLRYQNLENDEDGAQASPEPDGGVSTRSEPGVSSAIFFVPGILLLVPGVYHVIFIYCAVKGRRGFQFFYLPYFEK